MKKSLNNKILLQFFLFFLIPLSFIYDTQSTQSSCCGCHCGLLGCDCPQTCRPCYDCVSPCECRAIHPCKGAPFVQYRSQSLNKAKEIVGLQPYIHKADQDKLYGVLYSSIEFTNSFRSNLYARSDTIDCFCETF